MTDEDFSAPTRSVELPTLPKKVDEAIGANGKPVIIKKNIFERNAERHADLTADDSRNILQSALYNANLYGQNQKAKRPYNWVVINTKDKEGNNRLVLIELSPEKENAEIVHWHYIDDKGLDKIKRQAEREDGQLLILPSEGSEEAGALSGPTNDLSSDGKATDNSSNRQVNGVKNSGIEDDVSMAVRTVVEDIRSGKMASDVSYGNQRMPVNPEKMIAAARKKRIHGNVPLVDVYDRSGNALSSGGKRASLRKQKTGSSASEVTEAERALRDELNNVLTRAGIEVVTDVEEGQRVLDEVNGGARMQAKKRALETASVTSKEEHQPTVVSSADGAKILKNLDKLVEDFEKLSNQSKFFTGTVAEALGAQRKGSKSEYATFETKNGRIVTIRLADHNATVSNFDRRGELEGISIVVSSKKSEGITNDGDAHVVEYYYDAIKLRRAEGKPLADIVRSIKQALYSG